MEPQVGPSPPRPRRVTPTIRVTALIGLLVAGAVAIQSAAVAPTAVSVGPVLLLAFAFFIAESVTVHLPVGEDSHSISLVEIPLVVGFGMIGATGVIAARVLGSGLALVLVRRRGVLKTGFNLSLFYLETAAALAVFALVTGGTGISSLRGWAGVVAALVAMQTIGAIAVAVVITIHDRAPKFHAWKRTFLIGLVGSLIAGAWGLAVDAVLVHDPIASVPLLVLGLGLYLVLRMFGRLNERHEDLQTVFSFTEAVTGGLEATDVTGLVLGEISDHFHVQVALLVSGDDRGGGIHVREGRTTRHIPQTPAETEELLSAMGSGEHLVDEAFRARLGALTGVALLDAAASAFADSAGAIVIANPSGPQPLGPHQLRLLATVARHTESVFERRRLVDRLRAEVLFRHHQATHDALTGLPNRTQFTETLERRLAERGSRSEAVLLLDVDDFKQVNDTLGHTEGDGLIVDLGVRVQTALRPGDFVARFGGDEFALIVSVANPVDAIAIARRIEEALRKPFWRAGISLELRASIGIAIDGDAAETMVQRADIAMYAAKEAGTGHEVFAPEMDVFSAPRLALAGELQPAIDNGEVQVFYQPKVDAVTGEVVSVEALARWFHPERGSVSPAEFIPIAQRTGLITPLTVKVLETAMLDAGRWRRQGLRLSVAVNISPRTLTDSDFPAMISGACARSGVGADSLIVEITEDVLLSDSAAAIAVLERLDEMGIDVSIDDFGTGHSSLTRLRELPVDEIKIDRSFIKCLTQDPESRVIVASTIDLAQQLGKRVVAEGVEDEATLEALREMGCDLIQGYLYSPAIPAADLATWVHARRAALAATR